MEQKSVRGKNLFNSKKEKHRSGSYMVAFSLMIVGILVIFGYVYQSTKQVYLNYEIVNLNKEINELDIKLQESKVENVRLQTNESIEKAASEKLGMSYEKANKVMVVKETTQENVAPIDNDKIKIKIFMNSLYEEMDRQLKQFSINNIINYFTAE